MTVFPKPQITLSHEDFDMIAIQGVSQLKASVEQIY